jgi:prophage antirepressor-like protein
MSNQIKIFDNPRFGAVRIVTTENNEPLFCLTDVCHVLGLKAGHVKERLSKDVVSTEPLMTACGILQVNFVNEDGLYDVILDSRKPEAKAFRKWITSVVLLSIRKNGINTINMTHEEVYQEVLKGLKDKKSITYTLKRLNYASRIFYAQLNNLQRKELKTLKTLNAFNPPPSYGISTFNWRDIEEFFEDEENHPDRVQISI